jgi:predicted Rossmann-fold nucleotide-binding protein
VIAVGGEFGTLSEIALALRLGTPVVGVRTWELAKAGRPVDAIVRVDDPDQAAARALELAAFR